MTFPHISSRSGPECSQDDVTEPGNTTETPLAFATKPSHSRTHTFHTHSSRATPPPNQTINLLAIIPKTTKSPHPRELLTCTNIPEAIKTPSPTPITHTTLPLPSCSSSPLQNSRPPHPKLLPKPRKLHTSENNHIHTPLDTHKIIPTLYKQPAQC